MTFSPHRMMLSHPSTSDKPQDYCGVLGLYGPGADISRLAYFGLYALQHRGRESAGIATFDRKTPHIHKADGLVSQVFNETILESLSGQLGVGHTRYSPSGSHGVSNAQPITVKTRLGTLALAHNGNLINAHTLKESLEKQEYSPKTTTDAELIALTIAAEVDAGRDWKQATTNACQKLEGVFSLTMATPEGLLATRDAYGIRPLVIGILPQRDRIAAETHYVLASETCDLDLLDAEYVRAVEPGELIWINDDGLTSWICMINAGVLKRMKFTALLVNTSPDDVMNMPDVRETLPQGEIGGVALDLLLVDEFLETPNTTLSCRRAWFTMECFLRRINQWKGTLVNYLAGQKQKKLTDLDFVPISR